MARAGTALETDDARLLNRELSWLDYNARVLAPQLDELDQRFDRDIFPNNLTDEELIEELYRAAQEGAKIDIVARSICTLRPGVPGLSETIRVRSILGRFLEHSRFYIFDAGGRRTFLLGSADLMPRNLDHRIEVLAPVEDGRAQQDLLRAFDVLLADNASAWEMSSEGRWMKLRPKKGDRGRQAQQVFMRSARARARRRAASGSR